MWDIWKRKNDCVSEASTWDFFWTLDLPHVNSSSVQSEHQQTLGTYTEALKWKKNGVKGVESHELIRWFLPAEITRLFKEPLKGSKLIPLLMYQEDHKSEIFRGLETWTKNKLKKDVQESVSFRNFLNQHLKLLFRSPFWQRLLILTLPTISKFKRLNRRRTY